MEIGLKLKEALSILDRSESIRIAKQIADEEVIEWTNGASFVFSAIVNDLERVPGNIGGKNDDEVAAIRKWLIKYQRGYEGRASQRVSNPLGTVADPIVETIIGARLTDLLENELNSITYGHRLGMSAENILGLILEEYLFDNLKDYGWHCAWGETVKSVDFVHEDRRLLQIKNRSNSENSSSNKVRDGTEINKWYRIKADRIEYMWGALNAICGTEHLSEESFVNFVEETIASNPNCIAIEQDNPWG